MTPMLRLAPGLAARETATAAWSATWESVPPGAFSTVPGGSLWRELLSKSAVRSGTRLP